ncbi:PRC and DUF2382 domain-containing protein [Modestobacter sp. Leaf380]|uniref:PRC and DUF2382 domain-containing protein n=1 Tax=Modestobacter sp. Leaf380 TaxID=1736356 RepID=UPI0006FA1397|nr:PRC and DUF2382 domain-containing protein [Modestobacter sp. Leaf380]KQS66678.1 photosystem reaction center subunit H [Modestobacter sp. Leaf380]
MITTESIDRVIGSDVYDADGDKIGTANEVFLDDQSGNPEWVTVKTGLFGTKSTFVPLRDADLTGEGLRVPVSKAAVKDAPKVDADQHLSPQEEQELYRHYGFEGNSVSGQDTLTGRDTTTTAETTTTGQAAAGPAAGGVGRTGDRDATLTGQHSADTRDDDSRGTVGRDTSGPTTDDAMTRSEEVVTENVTRTVPVSHEEVRIEREPITDANRGDALDGPALSEEEHEVTLHAERPVVEKETVPVERVRLDTQTVTEQQTVNETVAHEEIEQVEGDTTRGTGVTGRDTTR